MAGRFIKLYDKILKWEWYGDANTFRLFIHLLLRANYKDMRFEGRVIHRGQMTSSLTHLADELALTVRQVRVSLEHLKVTGEVTVESNNRYSVITIVRYDEYQSSDRQNDRQMTGNMTGKRQADDRQMTGGMTRQMTTSIEYIEDNIEQIEKNRKTATQFSPPTRDELADFLQEIGSGIDPDYFLDYYNARGWEIKPRQKMKDWKATVRNWQRRETGEVKAPVQAVPVQAPSAPKKVTAQNYEQRDYSHEDDDAISAFMRRTEGLWK